MLSYVVKECLASKLGEVLVVLGAEEEKMRAEIDTLNCMIIVNDNWESGQASSIACAAQSIDEESVEGVYVVLVDQVHFSKNVLKKIETERKKSDGEILVCQYQEGSGPPSFFHKSYLPALCKLSGAQGAKPIIKDNKSKVVQVKFPLGHLDIDFPKDLKRLRDL